MSLGRKRLREKSQQQSSKQVTKRLNDNVLFLNKNHVTFENPDRGVSIFFDECNCDIISLYNNAGPRPRVVFQTTTITGQMEFVLPVEKKVLSTKMNRSRTILAYQVDKRTIEFVNINKTPNSSDNRDPTYSLSDRRYTLTSRARSSKILSFIWVADTEVVLITDITIESYNIDPSRNRSRFVKSFTSSTNWFVFQPNVIDSASVESSILMVSTGSVGNTIQPYVFTRGQIVRLERFIVDGQWHEIDVFELSEHNVTIEYLYGSVRLLVLQNESLNIKSKGAQILIYTLDQETGITSKTHTLDMDISGRFAINVVDNLVIAHDQPSRRSFVFDIMIESTEKSDCPNHFVNIIGDCQIKLRESSDSDERIPMYSINWVFFQPHFIIDVKLGVLYTLNIDLDAIQTVIHDRTLLLSFLALRKGSEKLMLSICRDVVASSIDLSSSNQEHPRSFIGLADVSSTFEILSKLVMTAPELVVDKDSSLDDKILNRNDSFPMHRETIQQDDVYRDVLRQLNDESDECQGFRLHLIVAILMEFIFIMRRQDKDVDFQIYEQLVKILARAGRFFQIVQMIRSEILKDSKRLGCLLLSLRKTWEPAAQLGKDMLQRLDCRSEFLNAM